MKINFTMEKLPHQVYNNQHQYDIQIASKCILGGEKNQTYTWSSVGHMYDVLVGGRSLSLQLLPENPENQWLEDVFLIEMIPLKRGHVFFFFFFRGVAP